MQPQIALLAVAICLLHAPVCYAQEGTLVDYATKANSGDLFTGGLGLNGISLFISPQFLPDGEVYFTGNLDNGEQAVIADDQIAIVTGTQVGGAAPGTEIDFFGQSEVNALGDIVLSAVLGGSAVDSTNDAGIVFYNGTVNMIVQKGDTAPGTTEVVDFFSGLRHDFRGGVRYTSGLEPSGDRALFTRVGGTTSLVERTGTVKPDGAVVADLLGHTNILLEDQDTSFVAAFMTLLFDPNLSRERTQLSLLKNDNSQTSLIATGDSPPGLPASTTLSEMFVPKGNNRGDLTLFADFEGASTGRSILQLDVASTGVTGGRSVARIGDAAPGVAGYSFDFFNNFVLNETGQVAIHGEISPTTPPNQSESGPQEGAQQIVGVWFEDASNTLQLAGHNGMQAPGLADGITLQQVSFPAFNALNQVAFKSALAGPGVEIFVNDEALWATDPDGILQLVARTGELFDVDDDPGVEDLRTINDIGVIANSGGTGGHGTSFNDAGELAFTLNFSDFTSGVFVASFATPTLSTDLDNDGDVDGRDFLLFQQTNPSLIPAWEAEFGLGIPLIAAQAVPEPTTLLLALTLTALPGRARRDRSKS